MIKIREFLIKEKLLINTRACILWGFLSFVIISCSVSPVKKNDNQTQKEMVRSELYQQGLVAYNKNHIFEAEKAFSRIVEDTQFNDIYSTASMWNLIKIYETQKFYHKAIIFLLELEKNQRNQAEILKIQQHLIFNYVYSGDIERAKKIEIALNKYLYKIENKEFILFEVLSELMLLESGNNHTEIQNLDQLLYLGIINKYVLFILEACAEQKCVNLIDQLKNNYLKFINLLNQDRHNSEFKKNVAIEMLQQLRFFENYVIDYDLDDKRNKNIKNNKNIQDFLNFSKQKQKYLTEWLHQ